MEYDILWIDGHEVNLSFRSVAHVFHYLDAQDSLELRCLFLICIRILWIGPYFASLGVVFECAEKVSQTRQRRFWLWAHSDKVLGGGKFRPEPASGTLLM